MVSGATLVAKSARPYKAQCGAVDSGREYQLLFFMEPRDEVNFHDLNMIIQAAREGATIHLGLLTGDNVKGIAAVARPFFTAPDYRP